MIHSGRHLYSRQRMSRSFHSCTLLRNHLVFRPESSGNGQLEQGSPDSLSMHQGPHHLTSEHALSMPYVKGGHRCPLASHAMGVTSTKCCCSSCVRNVPYGVNVLKPQLLLWILVSLSSALHICAGFAFSLNLLRNYCRKPCLAMRYFLHLCCRRVTGAESVTAVMVYLL